MKTSYTLFIGILTLVWITSCGDDPVSNDRNNPNLVSQDIGSNGGSITSKDQRLTLAIPAGALGNTETITIEEITENDLGSEFAQLVEEFGVDKVYSLGPDGLTFNNPVTASFKSDQVPSLDSDTLTLYAQFMFTSFNGTVEILDVNQKIDGVSGEPIVLESQLSHFSPLVSSKIQQEVDNRYKLRIFVTVQKSSLVGYEFAVPVGVVNNNPKNTILEGLYNDSSEKPLERLVNPTDQELTKAENPPDRLEGEFLYKCTDSGTGKYKSVVRTTLKSLTIFSSFSLNVECIKSYSLSVEVKGEGSVIFDENEIICESGEMCSEDYPEQQNVLLRAIPADGSEFIGWTGDIPDDCENSTLCTLEMDRNRTVQAIFAKYSYPSLTDLQGTWGFVNTVISNNCTDQTGETEFNAGFSIDINTNKIEIMIEGSPPLKGAYNESTGEVNLTTGMIDLGNDISASENWELIIKKLEGFSEPEAEGEGVFNVYEKGIEDCEAKFGLKGNKK